VILRLGEDQIGTVKTAAKLSTRISFRESVKEIVCGDLYDPTSGTGSFVVQRIDNDVFIKPVASKGESNMFVKAGERGEHTYNLSLVIVSPDQAYTIVKVIYGGDNDSTVTSGDPQPATSAPKTVPVGFADFSTVENSIPSLHAFSFRNFSEPLGTLPAPPILANVAASGRTPINRVSPDYPEYAKRTNMVGDVVLELTIDKPGSVKSVKVISGSLVFRSSAVSAARLWKFTPIIDDQPYGQSKFLIRFRFRGPDVGTDALLGSSPRL
jgi:TonB family protein